MESKFGSRVAVPSSSSSRRAKRTSLKRSKSLHCNGGRFGTMAEVDEPNGRQVPQLYASRRHHSTNGYMAEYEDESLGSRGTDYYARDFNSSSHSLYNQFLNDSSSQQLRGSSSSGASILSFGESNNRQRDYFEDVFYDPGQLCAKMNSLSMGKPLLNPYRYHNLDVVDILVDDTSEELDSPVEKRHTKSVYHKASYSRKQVQLYRFYIIKQRNYPPLYLGAGPSRRRIFRILVLGFPSSGKTSLIEQFAALVDHSQEVRFHPTESDQLGSEQNLLIHFLESDSFDKYLLRMPVTDYQPDAYLILYSVNNRDSFNSVKKTLIDLQRWDDVETKSIIIVANKSDLVRSRCVTRREGRELASDNNCKYIETSCTISHNIDVLLQGIGSQICLKQKALQQAINTNNSASKPRRKPSFFKRILRKTALSKSKSCDNLHVL